MSQRLTHPQYYARFALAAALLIALSLLIGVAGYHYMEELPWIDALENASMILGGMGPVDVMKTYGGKLFASVYALYSCFVAIGVAGVLLMPLFHLTLKRFHSDPEE